jgi:hypothetical protein
VPRPLTEPGKGSYWQLDISEGEGYKRPRKRKRKVPQGGEAADGNDSSNRDDGDMSSPSSEPQHNIDSGLQDEGHRVGAHQGNAVRSDSFSSYSGSVQPTFGQPSFGSGSTFPLSSTPSFPTAFQSSQPVSLAPIPVTNNPPPHPGTYSYDRNAAIPQQRPRPGTEIEYHRDGRFPTARRVGPPPTHINPAHLSDPSTSDVYGRR